VTVGNGENAHGPVAGGAEEDRDRAG
jgi:hypothetical protein